MREDPSDANGFDGPPGPVGTGEPGVACEGALPGSADFEPVASEGIVPGGGVVFVEDGVASPAQQYGAGGVYCEDCASREEAQTAVDAGPEGSSGLDMDGDGLACEEDEAVQYAQEETTPSGGALAQPIVEPPVDPADYVLGQGGEVIVDGDQGMSCRDFALDIPQADASSDLEQARRVLEQCEEAGFLSSDATVIRQPDQAVSPMDRTPSGKNCPPQVDTAFYRRRWWAAYS